MATPAEIAAIYDRLAPHWAPPDALGRNGIAAHELALRFAAKPGTALEVGCGANGRLRRLLEARGWSVEGIDISAATLALARSQFPRSVFHLADICTWELPRAYELISAWDSIWHVPLAEQRSVVEKLARGLAPGGVLIFTAGGLDRPDEVTNPCHGVPLYHATPGIPALLATLQEARCALRHFEFDQWPEKHLVLIAQRCV